MGKAEGQARHMPPGEQYSLYFNRSSIHTVLRRACAEDKANIPRLALYSIRHRGTTVLRNAKVPKEQIDYQLGHVQGGARSTQDYGQYEPEYLSEAAAALEAWIKRVMKLAAQKDRAEGEESGMSKDEIMKHIVKTLQRAGHQVERAEFPPPPWPPLYVVDGCEVTERQLMAIAGNEFPLNSRNNISADVKHGIKPLK
jgi:hypothetical protein